MKKSGKLKRFGLSVTAAFVCLAFVLSGFAFVKPLVSFAAETEEPTTTTVTTQKLFEKVTVQDKVNYGDDIDVTAASESGVAVKVVAPDGVDVSDKISGDKIKATQMGNYTVTYYKTDDESVAYSFNVLVTLSDELFLRVDHNGADIPTYIKKGETFKLPAANVVYYDENNILQKYDGAVVYKITDSVDPAHAYAADDTYEAKQTGKIYLTYSASIGGADGKKFFNKTFTVNVQNTLSESSAPTLAVAGVPQTISINRPITLPTATATDSYDENVKIEITVLDPDNKKVQSTEVNRYGYAYQVADKDYGEVVFDNDKAMTFYPIKVGTYMVKYTATNDAGKSATAREYQMECKDSAAPVFENVHDELIPETWGKEVKKLNDQGESEVDQDLSGKITFTVPELVDNKDHMYAEKDGDSDLITLYFRITDADNSRTIVEFTNILADPDSDDCKFKGNATYGEKDGDTYKTEVFNKDNDFVFDFAKYNKKDSSGKEAELPGTYTVYFRARDKAQNTSSRTFTITLEDTFTDDAAPSTAEVTVPSYISATDKELVIPTPVVADSKDSRPEVTYKIYNDNDEYIDVEGGEIAELVKENDGVTLYIDKGKSDNNGSYEKKLALTDSLYFYVAAKDKVGNVKTNTTDDDYKNCDAVVKVVSSSDATFTYNDEISLADLGNIHTGDTVKVGGFNISGVTKAMRNYTGFEVAVLDPNGNPINVTLDTCSILNADDSATIYVKNIEFKASVVGEHIVTVRAFDVNGNHTVKAYKFNVLRSTTGSGSTSATVIGTTGSVNVKYKLHNETMTGIGDENDPEDETYYVVRQIKGGIFSLMGSELVAKTQGSYYVRDGYVTMTKLTEGYTTYEESVTPYGGNNGKYSFSITDTAAPIIEVQGVMPTYWKKYDKEDTSTIVTLPSVIAYTDNGNAVVDVKVTNSKGNKVDVEHNDADNTYTFKGVTDGAYTVVYTATYMKATPATATYTINIGDVVGPEFTVSGGSNGRMVVGNTFTFGSIVLADGESSDNVTVTKKLIDPSKEDVSSATVTGSYNSYKDKANNGTDITLGMAGQYEVVYTATDSVGNVTTQRYTITVVSSGSGTPTTITTLSTVLIIIAVVLLAGVIVYVVRFRKVKEKKAKS